MRITNVFTLWAILIVLAACAKKIDGYAPSVGETFTSLPGNVVITSPVTLSAITKTALTITGTCQTGASVIMTGDSEQSLVCMSAGFAFTVTKATSGKFNFYINQRNSAGSSGSIKISWTFDNLAPAAVIISSPLSNPYSSGDSVINISGSCEAAATVYIVGDFSSSTPCSGGTFTFNGITKVVDGSYVFNITQMDVATNVSQIKTLTWVRDTTIPESPTITNFTENPRFTKTSPLVVSGACVSGNTVSISEGGVDLASQVCGAGNTYTINVSKVSNGSYTLALYQTDPVSLNDSANRDFVWIYDSVAPVAPVINNPAVSPVTTSGTLIISGGCETNATVNLTGDDTQSKICSAGAFSFAINKTVDATYNFNLTQTDRALNTSTGVSQVWIRDTNSLAQPTIDTPDTDPFISNATNLILSGVCQDGLTVVLSGVAASDVLDPANSLSRVCVGSTYSFRILKPDGTYSLSVLQTNGTINSGAVTQSWTKDTVEPFTTISSTPPATNYSTQATFAFSSNEAGSEFECSLNNSPYTTCVSPITYTDLSNSNYTMKIRAIDLAGNVESNPASYSWVHSAAKAVALYNLDASDPTKDSSNYTDPSTNNRLTTDTSTDYGTAVFNEGRTFSTTANSMSAPDSLSLRAISEFLTLESRIRIPVLPTGGALLPIVSKFSPGAASFEYGIKRVGGGAGKYFIYFKGSTNGTTFSEKKSLQLSGAEVTALTSSGFAYVAVTWNLGAVKFYFNGVSKGSAIIGTAGSSRLAPSTGLLRLGYSQDGNNSLTGSIDEVRISQIIRTNFSVPSEAYTAD